MLHKLTSKQLIYVCLKIYDGRDQIIPLNIFYGSFRAVLFKMSYQ